MRELATLDEKSTSSEIAEPYLCATKIECKNRGGRRDDTCDHGLSKSWKKVKVCEKKRKNLLRVTTKKVVTGTFFEVVVCRRHHFRLFPKNKKKNGMLVHGMLVV